MSLTQHFDPEAFHAWYEQNAGRLIAEVRRKLFEMTRTALAITSNDVAHSAIVSFLVRHGEEVDWKDPQSITYIMVGVAWRHAEKYNARHGRRDKLNKEGSPLVGVQRDYEVAGEGDDPRFEPVDVREKTSRLFYTDCVAAFRALGIDSNLAQPAGEVLSLDPDGAALCRSLTPLEAQVVACKIARMSTRQIAEALQRQQPELDETDVRNAWRSIRKKAEWLGEEAT